MVRYSRGAAGRRGVLLVRVTHLCLALGYVGAFAVLRVGCIAPPAPSSFCPFASSLWPLPCGLSPVASPLWSLPVWPLPYGPPIRQLP